MRISTGKCWLAATALVVGIANGEDPIAKSAVAQDTVRFTEGFPVPAIIYIRTGDAETSNRTFHWISRNTQVERVKLRYYDPSSQAKEIELAQGEPPRKDGLPLSVLPQSDGTENTAGTKTRSLTESLVTGTPPKGEVRRTKRTDMILNVVSDTTSGQVSFNLEQLPPETRGRRLYFEAIWAKGLGHSYSRQFAVVQDGNDMDFERLGESRPLFDSPDPYREEQKPTSALDSEAPAANTQTASPSSNPQTIGNQGEKDSTSGGLAQGAVIGIAVGAGVLGLIAVFAFVWIVVRRQRRKQNLHHMDSYNSGSHADDLIAEKEARAGVDVTTPQSPYSDDGIVAAAAALTPAAVSSTHLQQQQDPNQTFTPYTDRSSTALRQADEGRTSVVPSPIPGRSTPRDLTTPYAHLVEEGMTEDDVRRLEEEERQLDAAIEQARRR